MTNSIVAKPVSENSEEAIQRYPKEKSCFKYNFRIYPVGKYMFKVNNRTTRTSVKYVQS